MIRLSPEAHSHSQAFERFYTERRRPQALRNLGHALAEASLVILDAPNEGQPFPRPYPKLRDFGLLWVKRGRCGIAYDPIGPVVAGIFFETDDIPRRVGEQPDG